MDTEKGGHGPRHKAGGTADGHLGTIAHAAHSVPGVRPCGFCCVSTQVFHLTLRAWGQAGWWSVCPAWVATMSMDQRVPHSKPLRMYSRARILAILRHAHSACFASMRDA